MFRLLRKRWVLRGYRTRLPSLLRRDYGKADFYTPDQIRASIDRHGLSTYQLCYALALYTDRASFDAYHDARGESCDYGLMRDEMSGFGDLTTLSFVNACHHLLHAPDATHHHHAAHTHIHHDAGGGHHGHH